MVRISVLQMAKMLHKYICIWSKLCFASIVPEPTQREGVSVGYGNQGDHQEEHL